jgi:V/A-type H+-transporting ATPase subunit E
MAQEIKDLIAKIQREGIKIAEEKSAQIKSDADLLAQKIIEGAKSQAQQIVEKAVEQVKKLDESTQASLKQAGRDLLISLRKEINAMLNNLVKAELNSCLSVEVLAGIIATLIKNAPLTASSQITISLSSQDKEKLEKGFLKQIAQEIKKQIVLKSSDSIQSGFVISFDAGKSVFDFSDQALTQYLTDNLRPELSKILEA